MDKEQKKAYQREYMRNKRKKAAQDGPGSAKSNKPDVRQGGNVRQLDGPVVRQCLLDGPAVRQDLLDGRPANYGTPDCQCRHCFGNRSRLADKRLEINHGPWLTAEQLGYQQVNRVALPGDADYRGIHVA